MAGKGQTLEFVVNIVMILFGLVLFFAGTYTSIQSILDTCKWFSFVFSILESDSLTLSLIDASGPIKHPFRCGNSGFDFTR